MSNTTTNLSDYEAMANTIEQWRKRRSGLTRFSVKATLRFTFAQVYKSLHIGGRPTLCSGRRSPCSINFAVRRSSGFIRRTL